MTFYPQWGGSIMPVMTALSVTLPCLVAPIFAVLPTCQPPLTATLTPDNQGTVGHGIV